MDNMDGAPRRGKVEGQMRRDILDRQYQQRLENATMEAWKTDPTMFPKSWILNDLAACQVLEPVITSNRKAKLECIAVLKLEKQAIKWFNALPRAYFVDCIVPRICAAGSTSPAVQKTAATSTAPDTPTCFAKADPCNPATKTTPAWLSAIFKTLQHVLFDLTQQNKNGVPLAFLEAHDAWSLQNPGANSDCMVVAIKGPAAAKRAKSLPTSSRRSMPETIDLTGSPSSPATKRSAITKTPPEIIEIL